MTQKILITGGLGYLGGRIAQHLNKQNTTSVRLGARFRPSGYPNWCDKFNIINFDFESPRNLLELCKDVDVIIHLAALNAQDSIKNPDHAWKINVEGTKKLINAATYAGVARFIYFSTTHVYGTSLNGTIDEKQKPIPSGPYAKTHLEAEKVVLNESNLDGIVLRLSNVVGAPSDPFVNCWSLISNELCREVIKLKTLTLRGTGQDFRDFLCMNDLLEVVTLILNADRKTLADKLFNIVSGNTIVTLTLANLIGARSKSLFGICPNISYKKSFHSPPKETFVFSNARASNLGFEISPNITNEIDSTLKFCNNVLS